MLVVVLLVVGCSFRVVCNSLLIVACFLWRVVCRLLLFACCLLLLFPKWVVFMVGWLFLGVWCGMCLFVWSSLLVVLGLFIDVRWLLVVALLLGGCCVCDDLL